MTPTTLNFKQLYNVFFKKKSYEVVEIKNTRYSIREKPKQ